MEPFDTHFVYFGPILPISGMKLLVTSCYYPGKTDQCCIAAIDGWNAKSDEKL